jgi:hypothetical protein
MTLYILSVRTPNGEYKEPQVFEAEGEDPRDHQKDLTTLLDREEKFWKDKGCVTSVLRIYGMAVEPLRKYFLSKEKQQ